MGDAEKIISFLGRAEDFRAWNGFPGMDWETYQLVNGNVEQAVYWCDIIMPQFIESNGLIIRKNLLSTVQLESSNKNISVKHKEYLLNHLHVSDLFANDKHLEEYGSEVFEYIAKTIAKGWCIQLHNLFPEKKFDVGIDNSAGDYVVYATTISDNV